MDKDRNITKGMDELPQRIRKLPPKTIMSSTPTTLKDNWKTKWVEGKFIDAVEVEYTPSQNFKNLELGQVGGKSYYPVMNEKFKVIEQFSDNRFLIKSIDTTSVEPIEVYVTRQVLANFFTAHGDTKDISAARAISERQQKISDISKNGFDVTKEKTFKVPKKIPIDTMGDWMESMYILLGCVLNKLGQKGIELTARDLEKFDATRSLKYSKSANGKLSYQVVKKPKGEV